MNEKIPNSVIGAVSSVISAHYNSHSKLNALFMESGAPGDPPDGNCEAKCSAWLKRSNEDPNTNALDVLGQVIQNYMDQDHNAILWGREQSDRIIDGQKRIRDSLAKNQLNYQINGRVIKAGAGQISKTLAEYIEAGDFASIEAEFKRAVDQVETDPHAAITAACSIVEAFCKVYIETVGLVMPPKQTIRPLWNTVNGHMGLNTDRTLSQDQNNILQGLASLIHGIGDFRTHIGSVHGRGISPPRIQISDARLAVNASHTLVIFLMERWEVLKSSSS